MPSSLSAARWHFASSGGNVYATYVPSGRSGKGNKPKHSLKCCLGLFPLLDFGVFRFLAFFRARCIGTAFLVLEKSDCLASSIGIPSLPAGILQLVPGLSGKAEHSSLAQAPGTSWLFPPESTLPESSDRHLLSQPVSDKRQIRAFRFTNRVASKLTG